MKKSMTKLLNKMGVKKVKGLKNNNKGFSLIELLIVIAIMGVLAAIAFNMFGGVLTNSKKRADAQQARNIEKAILTYCLDSGDWVLTATAIDESTGKSLVKSLLNEIEYKGEKYGPMLSPKYPDKANDHDDNVNALMPQWNISNDGKYADWDIKIYKTKQSVVVKPTETNGCAVTTNATETVTP